MKTLSESHQQMLNAHSEARAVPLAGLLVLLSLLAVGCRTSLEHMAQREIEKRPVSKVYLNGLKYFGDLVRQGQAPGLKSGEGVVYQPSEDLMTEEEMRDVKYPFKMAVKLKKKDNEGVLYSYALLKESPTAGWRIVEAWRGQVA